MIYPSRWLATLTLTLTLTLAVAVALVLAVTQAGDQAQP